MKHRNLPKRCAKCHSPGSSFKLVSFKGRWAWLGVCCLEQNSGSPEIKS